jgi:hypothetical protein
MHRTDSTGERSSQNCSSSVRNLVLYAQRTAAVNCREPLDFWKNCGPPCGCKKCRSFVAVSTVGSDMHAYCECRIKYFFVDVANLAPVLFTFIPVSTCEKIYFRLESNPLFKAFSRNFKTVFIFRVWNMRTRTLSYGLQRFILQDQQTARTLYRTKPGFPSITTAIDVWLHFYTCNKPLWNIGGQVVRRISQVPSDTLANRKRTRIWAKLWSPNAHITTSRHWKASC